MVIRSIDITGLVVGKLTVMHLDTSGVERKNRSTYWVCRCSCGNIVVKDSHSLRHSQSASCGCDTLKNKDYTGEKYGRSTAIKNTGKVSCNKAVWLWKCDCGNEFESSIANFIYKKVSYGCPSCVKKRKGEKTSGCKTTHGMSGTKEYIAWCKIRSRTQDVRDPDYPVYSVLGMNPSFVNDFKAFYKEVGPCPTGGGIWSVGRIDNNIGYMVGNIRWETAAQQARNKGMYSSNKSGINGVRIHASLTRNKKKYIMQATASWRDLNGTSHHRTFSFNKYGEELAILCAIEARDQAIRLLNQQGAGYAANHGKD